MKLLQQVFYSSLAVAALSLGIGFGSKGLFGFVVLPLLIASFWALSHWRSWAWGNPLSFGLYCLVIAVGVWQGVSVVWLLLGIASSIVSWDLSHLIAKGKGVDKIIDQVGMMKRHFLRLGWVLVIGLGLCLLALNLHLTITFGWTLILGLLMFLALSRVIRFLRD